MNPPLNHAEDGNVLTMSQPLVQLRHVDVRRGETEQLVLRDVNWSIAAGEFWLVRGSQGSGKTDLIQTAAGLAAPAAGQVTVDQLELVGATEETSLAVRRRVGFVFEHAGRLLNHLTVAGNIALPLLYHQDQPEDPALDRARHLLERAGLGATAGLLPGQLSPVIQQRVGYLRAVVGSPDILFVDHPVGLTWWAPELERLRTQRHNDNQPIAVVLSSVDNSAWDGLVDHVAVIEDEGVRIETAH